jgi:hypothetical protein
MWLWSKLVSLVTYARCVIAQRRLSEARADLTAAREEQQRARSAMARAAHLWRVDTVNTEAGHAAYQAARVRLFHAREVEHQAQERARVAVAWLVWHGFRPRSGPESRRVFRGMLADEA